MKKALSMLICLLLLASAAGCAPQEEAPGTLPPVSVPSETAPSDPTVKPTEPTTGTMNHGPIADVVHLGENGRYITYEGGEMHLPYEIHASGLGSYRGAGILLFIDGQPQPYKTTSDDTYRYMHKFYPESSDKPINITEEFIFTPVTGKEGDTLEFWCTFLMAPDFKRADGAPVGVLSSMPASDGIVMEFEATPPEPVYPPIKERLLSCELQYEDITVEALSGWTDQDMLEKVGINFRLNGGNPRTICSFTADQPVSAEVEVWGTPYIDFGVVFFVNNEPVTVKPQSSFHFGLDEGQKAIVKAELDLSDFEEEANFYAVVVPKNSCVTFCALDISTYAWLEFSSPSFFITADSVESLFGI